MLDMALIQITYKNACSRTVDVPELAVPRGTASATIASGEGDITRPTIIGRSAPKHFANVGIALQPPDSVIRRIDAL